MGFKNQLYELSLTKEEISVIKQYCEFCLENFDDGFDFTGCELDKDYWQSQEERFVKHGDSVLEKINYILEDNE
jgi:hypothetical protein